MNHLRASIDVCLDHNGLSDAQLRKLLDKIARVAVGRTQRECSVVCGDVSVFHSNEKPVRGKTLVKVLAPPAP